MNSFSCKAIIFSFSFIIGFGITKSAEAISIYTIGNSLTWDTRPSQLDGKVQWHVDCSKSLNYISNNPTSPCVDSSKNWENALRNNRYDFVTVQPWRNNGSWENPKKEINVISEWMDIQPNATFVIHTGWSAFSAHEDAYHRKSLNDGGVPSPEYFNNMISDLNDLHPQRSITRTKAIDVLDKIYHDIEAEKAPSELTKFSDLYRDKYHMTRIDKTKGDVGRGRYLMHNVMRTALNQPLSDKGFKDINPKMKNYLNQKIASVESIESVPFHTRKLSGLLALIGFIFYRIYRSRQYRS